MLPLWLLYLEGAARACSFTNGIFAYADRHLSNALSLEQLTAAMPGTGTLLTFLQFLLITTSALPNVLSFQYSGSWHIVPQLRERIIPLGPYVLQVALFLASSRLNNAAFAYAVPMSVHIVFRSGGVVISLILGRLILGRRYVI
jgi:UDP-xylose/UDP-N-acetylglucosamine transporter B4